MSDEHNQQRPAETDTLAIDAPETSANDEPITVRVTGTDPGATVELTATLEDGNDVEWSSRATFTADVDGVVDLSEHAPELGSYDGVAPMGWLWAMDSDADAPFARFGDWAAFEVSLRAEAADATVEHTITRVLFDDDVEAVPVDHDGVVGALYVPAGDGPHPGVIHLHGSGGRRGDGTARFLASNGYVALALRYFGDDDALPDELERIPLSYADDAADWLRDRPEVAAGRVGVVGASRGAEFALLLAAHADWVGAVVSFAGSGVPWDTPSDAPAWIHGGDPVPHIKADEHPTVTDLDERDLQGNVPPVENADGPILLLSGQEDNTWNASRLSDVVVERLDERDFDHDYEHRTYDDCGHLIGRPYAPLTGIYDIDHARGTPRGTVRAGEDAWPVVLEYLEDGLEKTE